VVPGAGPPEVGTDPGRRPLHSTKYTPGRGQARGQGSHLGPQTGSSAWRPRSPGSYTLMGCRYTAWGRRGGDGAELPRGHCGRRGRGRGRKEEGGGRREEGGRRGGERDEGEERGKGRQDKGGMQGQVQSWLKAGGVHDALRCSTVQSSVLYCSPVLRLSQSAGSARLGAQGQAQSGVVPGAPLTNSKGDIVQNLLLVVVPLVPVNPGDPQGCQGAGTGRCWESCRRGAVRHAASASKIAATGCPGLQRTQAQYVVS